ncbi:MAG: TatD family hydrolase [Thermodesulforhabdaceae bacterium]
MMLIDTHAHLDFPELSQDLEGVFRRALERSVVHIVTVGIDLKSSFFALKLAQSFPRVSATAGVHPHGAHELSAQEKDQLRDLLAKKEVVALGEIGLDYYRDRQPRAIQRRCFQEQLEIAVEVGKPVVFHVREAFDDFFSLVEPVAPKLAGGVVHCFSGDWEIAKRCLDLGFYISIPGVITYSNALILRDVVKRVPVNSILVETDAPFLAPVPYRGKPNEPSYVFYTAMEIANIKGMDLESLGDQTTQNAIRVFNISIQT